MDKEKTDAVCEACKKEENRKKAVLSSKYSVWVAVFYILLGFLSWGIIGQGSPVTFVSFMAALIFVGFGYYFNKKGRQQ